VGQFGNPRDVAQVVLRAGQPGNAVLLGDVAEIVLDYEDWEVQSRVDGRMSIALQARKKALADELHTAAAMREFVNSAHVPEGVQLVMVGDISRLSVNMLEVLGSNAALGLVAVLLLLWYFLEIRFALWVAIGIPFSLCLAFLMLAAVGVTINAMSLTAFIIVIGILVDDAVVVSENTARMRGQGLFPQEASIEGTAQVAPPVVFSALTTMLAFLPLLFLDGPNGEFMSPFPLGVILLLLASLFESQYLLPGHLAHVPARVQIPRRRLFEALRERYHALMLKVLLRRKRSLALFLLFFVAVLGIGASTIRFSLFPDIDIDTVQIKVELPVGSRFEQTADRVIEIEREIRQFVNPDDLLNITSQVGHHDTDFYGATEGRNHAWAVVTIQLQPLGRRAADTNTYELVQALQQWADTKTGFRSLVVQAQTDVPVTGKPVEVEVISSGEERFVVATQIHDWLRQHPGISNSWTSYNPGKDVIDLDFNHSLLVSRGLSVEQVIRALNVAVDGLLVDELQTLDERIYYRLQLPLSEAGRLSTLQNLMIINSRGEPVFLSAVADFRLRPGEADIKHYFGKRTITVYGEIDSARTTVGEINAELQRWVDSRDWGGRHPGLRVHLGGELEEQREALDELGRATWICVLLIFAALIALFNSLSQPLLVMICLPFGLIGVIIGYSIQDLTMGMMAITGIVGLMGVLVNDSLVMMHTLNRRRASLGSALSVEQVAEITHQRFRPIVITSVTTVVGLLPTAYGFLGENSYVKPLAMSMAWGVMFGGLVSLILLPVLYMLDQDLRRLARGLRLWLRLRNRAARGDVNPPQ
jgi:multidrug efflux pump subunit AcrB